MENFHEAIAGLSGRELMVSVRNQFLFKYYFDKQQKKRPSLFALYAELELDYFYHALLTAIIKYVNHPDKIEALIKAIKISIDRQINYFENLLD